MGAMKPTSPTKKAAPSAAKRMKWYPTDDRVQAMVWIARELHKRANHARIEEGCTLSELFTAALKEWLSKKGY
jgi:hypothetical protein